MTYKKINPCELECAWCGEKFTRYSGGRIYCSEICYHHALKEKSKYIKKGRNYGFANCIVCNKSFKKNTLKHKYCTTRCRDKDKTKNPQIIRDNGKRSCIICNRIYEVKSLNQKYCSKRCCKINSEIARKFYRFGGICKTCGRKFVSKGHRLRYCSDECRNKSKAKVDTNKSLRLIKLRFEVLKRDNFTCQYCGRSVREDRVKLHVDHIHPNSKGGKWEMENLVASCSDCNIGKSDVCLGEYNKNKLKGGLDGDGKKE